MRGLILLLLLSVAGYGTAQLPQGHNVSFYFWSCTVSGRLEDGRCCDKSGTTNCPDHCDVHFFVCIREHNETSIYCNENTTSHFTYFHYAFIDVHNITFLEGDNVFGTGLHNPLVYAFTGNWSKRVQTVLVARDYDYDDSTGSYEFEYIDNIVHDWTVPAGVATEVLTVTGEFNNLVADLGLKVECWEGWYGEYCHIYCVARDDIEGHYTCNQDGTKECLEHWSGVECTFSSTLCYPPCPVNRMCDSGACSACSQGYGGQDCTCEDTNICDPSGGHCQLPCVNGGVCTAGICDCPDFYTGSTCSETVDVCESSVAPSACPQTKGTCYNSPDTPLGYICTCASGYTGDSCGTDIDDCVDSPCGDNGNCVDQLDKFQCVCSAGFAGDLCQENIDECSSSPCLNGGTCEDGNNGYTCMCPEGTVAPVCQLTAECDRSSCSEHGDCEVEETSQSAVCSCDSGYTGDTCEILIDTCSPNPCPAGTNCKNGIGFYLCCETIDNCQDTSVSAINNQIPLREITITAVAMGIIIGMLVIVVIVVITIAFCIARQKKSNRVPPQRMGPPDAFANPIYEETLPTYEELGGITFLKEKGLPYEEPLYETMAELKVDLNAYMQDNRGFVSAEEEKRYLENKYS